MISIGRSGFDGIACTFWWLYSLRDVPAARARRHQRGSAGATMASRDGERAAGNGCSGSDRERNVGTANNTSRECIRTGSANGDNRAAARRDGRGEARAASTSAPRRRVKKPSGSRWLNRLLALGCLASLLPLYYEYSYVHSIHERPPSDDPWVPSATCAYSTLPLNIASQLY
eukprot:6195672-Pleurochrysis_carterae.AAC.3